MNHSNEARALVVAVALLLAPTIGCDDPAAVYDNATAPSIERELPPVAHGETTVGRGRMPPPAAITEAERLAGAAQAAGQGGRGGGRGGGGNTEQSRRYARLVDSMSDEDAEQLYRQMAGNARLQNSTDPCGRAYAAFVLLAEQAGDEVPSEEDFRENCSSDIPPELAACMKDEADRTQQENRICERLAGVTDVLRPHQQEPNPGRIRTPGGEPSHVFRQGQQQRRGVQ